MNEKVDKSTGIYITYPTSNKLKFIYRNYKSKVNKKHTKIGIAQQSFQSCKKRYNSTFNGEVKFIPIALLPKEKLKEIERMIINRLSEFFEKVDSSQEWFNTCNRRRFKEIILKTLHEKSIVHKIIQ